MATLPSVFAGVSLSSLAPQLTNYTQTSTLRRCPVTAPHSFTLAIANFSGFGVRFRPSKARGRRRDLTLAPAASMFSGNSVISDIFATALSGGIALSTLRIWEETARREIFDQDKLKTSLFEVFVTFWRKENKSSDEVRALLICDEIVKGLLSYERIFLILNRKLVHVSIGLVFMLCWPLFSSGRQGAVLASLIPGINIIKVLLIGLGIWKDEATVKSMSRFGDSRELLKGPLYYASTITLACVFYWRTSPISIAAICNLCAGDGLADIVGRRFGIQKIPYNSNKSIAGSIAMAIAGFIASIGFMHYFASFGYVEESWKLALGFLVVSLASTLVESLPISTELDDNLTVPLASMLVGSFIF